MSGEQGEGIRHAELNPPPDVIWIARTLDTAGFSAWAVGGAVRDALVGGDPGDWDLTTSARPGDVQRLFRRTAPIGIDHGTVGVISRSGQMFEVTTFRRDVETFGRKARVAFADTLEEDLERRDFTINAVAWNPLTGEVRDPHGGMSDLAARHLRTVGDPNRRFAEDRLRVLRALRFAGRFDLRIEEATWQAVVASADKLGNLSAERVREELWKVLTGPRKPSATLHLYAASGVLRALYPELEACRGVTTPPGREAADDLWNYLVRCADGASPARPLVRLAALLHAIGRVAPYGRPPDGATDGDGREAARSAAIARTLLRRLRVSNANVDRIAHLIAQRAPVPSADAPVAEIRRWIRRVGPDYLYDLFRLIFAISRASGGAHGDRRPLLRLRSRAAAVLRSRPPLKIADLAIDGRDLRAAGYPPGPLYGEILADLLERVTDDPSLNERTTLLEMVRQL